MSIRGTVHGGWVVGQLGNPHAPLTVEMESRGITLFRSITMFCGTDSIL